MPSIGTVTTEEKTSRSLSSQSYAFHIGVLVPILSMYFLLAFCRISHQSLWADEVLSLRYAAPESSLFNPAIWFRGQGPLYFVLLHLWGKLDANEFALRSLAALIGGAAVCLTYSLTFRLHGFRIAVLSAILLSTSPFFIWYSQEVRYITLMILTSLFAMYAFQRILWSSHRGWWIAYGFSLILAIAAFVANILLPVVQGMYLIGSRSRRPLMRKWLVCQILVFVPFLWWANGGRMQSLGGHWKDLMMEATEGTEEGPSGGRSQGLSSGGPREFSLAVVPYTFYAFSSGFSLGPSTQDLHHSRSWASLAPFAPMILVSLILFGGLFLAGLIKLCRESRTALLLLLWMIVPLLGALTVSFLTDMVYNVRYVAMVLPVFITAIAAGILSFRKTVFQLVFFLMVLIANGISLINYYVDPHYAREDARSAAKYLESATRPGDVILVVGSPTALRYYYKGTQRLVSGGKLTSQDTPEAIQKVPGLVQASSRLWLVTIRPWQTDPKGKVKAFLDQTFGAVELKRFPGVDIYCYPSRKEGRSPLLKERVA